MGVAWPGGVDVAVAEGVADGGDAGSGRADGGEVGSGLEEEVVVVVSTVPAGWAGRVAGAGSAVEAEGELGSGGRGVRVVSIFLIRTVRPSPVFDWSMFMNRIASRTVRAMSQDPRRMAGTTLRFEAVTAAGFFRGFDPPFLGL